jgi:hypothetical protein
MLASMEKLDPSYIGGRNAKWYSHFGDSLAISCKIEHTLTRLTRLLSIYSREMKTYVHSKSIT